MRAMVYRGPYRIRVEDKPRPLAKARTFAHAETHNFTEHWAPTARQNTQERCNCEGLP